MTRPKRGEDDEREDFKRVVASYVLEIKSNKRAHGSKAQAHQQTANFTRQVVNGSLFIGGLAGVVSLFAAPEYKQVAQVASVISTMGVTIGLSGQVIRVLRGDEGAAVDHLRQEYVYAGLLQEIEPYKHGRKTIYRNRAKKTMVEYDVWKMRAPFLTKMEKEVATGRVLWEDTSLPFVPGASVVNGGTCLEKLLFPNWNLPNIQRANEEGRREFIEQCARFMDL